MDTFLKVIQALTNTIVCSIIGIKMCRTFGNRYLLKKNIGTNKLLIPYTRRLENYLFTKKYAFFPTVLNPI